MSIGERLSLLFKESGLKQQQLADFLGVSAATISEYTKNKKVPKLENLIKICDFFNVTSDFLLDRQYESISNFIRVPVYGRIPAGVPMEAIEDIVDFEDIPADMAKGGKEFFALVVSGSSMAPKFEDGDTIICLRTQTCSSGENAVIMINNSDAVFKRIKIEPDGLLLEPINPAYKSTFYSSKEVSEKPVVVIGVVVELRRKIRQKSS